MVKDSIKDLFKYETWLGSVHNGFHIRILGTIAASGYVSVNFYVLALSSG
jgi:hypothetical protein